MSKKVLWKDIFKSVSKSKGRFLSIMGLMLLGSFALIGLKVTGPDMRATGANYFDELNTSDITVISDLGIDQDDQKVIDQTKGTSGIEYGYLKDVVIKNTHDSFRIFSEGDKISDYEIIKGRLPEKADEIAIDDAYDKEYKIGDTIEFTEKADPSGNKVLKNHKFKIVGYVYSGEIVSGVNLGQSTAGTGSLNGYAVVPKSAFDSDYYMLARMTFKDTKDLDPYSDEYTDKIQNHKDSLDKLLKDQPEKRLNSLKQQYQEKIDDAQNQINSAQNQIEQTQAELDNAKEQLTTGQSEIQEKQQELDMQVAAAQGQTVTDPSQAAAMQTALDEANQSIAAAKNQLAEKQQEYDAKNQEFQTKKADVEKQIAENQNKVNAAQETLDHLSLPVYSLNSRREIPGGEGYRIYSSVSWIVDALANVFPIFLYFVAALVTFTTMTRFVDEERLNSGTLKALGYENKDVLKKFTFYGLVSSLIGAITGIILGHTLLPYIVYNAYDHGFSLPKIEWHFYPGITLIALLLAVLSSVVPAWLVASKELKEKPAQLLQPKPPAAGSKILLERITPIWNHMSFTHKVTARNIFRYKKRMLMTIFGVAGAVALLFAGFSVQHSIGGINDRQFGQLIHYDMIVAENDYVTNEQHQGIEEALKSDKVAKNEMIHYEEMTKVAGDNKDTQEIKLIVPNDEDHFDDYISLNDRSSDKKFDLPKDGVVISERLAKLLNVEKGDTITLKDSNNQDRKMRVSDITEMYMGHFIFADKENYQKIFDQDFKGNAFLVTLKDRTLKNTENQSAKFMKLAGVKGVVQNTTLTTQINTIVQSLDKIMKVLIIIAALLGIVILYNLTNINVSERIRELSTIKVLGFYNKEVTMYIYRETILLTILGIAVGYGFGQLLHLYILNVVPPDDVMFNPALNSGSFVIPAIIIALITLVLGFFVNHRLKNVDMLEALKSVD